LYPTLAKITLNTMPPIRWQKGGGQIRIHNQIMSTIAGDLVTTTASTGTSINYAGQSQLVADGKLDVPVSGQTGEYHLEDRSHYRIQDTESVQSLWANDAWTETGHSLSSQKLGATSRRRLSQSNCPASLTSG